MGKYNEKRDSANKLEQGSTTTQKNREQEYRRTFEKVIAGYRKILSWINTNLGKRGKKLSGKEKY